MSNGHIAYFPAMKAFVNLPTENELTFNAEEYSDISGNFFKMLHPMLLTFNDNCEEINKDKFVQRVLETQ